MTLLFVYSYLNHLSIAYLDFYQIVSFHHATYILYFVFKYQGVLQYGANNMAAGSYYVHVR